MKYAKIVNNSLVYAPRNNHGISNWINDEDAVKADGYYPFPDFTVPENKYVSGYEIQDEMIVPIFNDIVQHVPDYRELRRAAYPAIEEQLDLIYWDRVNNTNLWVDTITEIKQKYPKPTGTVETADTDESTDITETENTNNMEV